MIDWQSISTAPKDGTWILVTGQGEPDDNGSYGDCWMAICRWDHAKWRDQWDDYYGPFKGAYWMPLPPPPNQEGESA